MRLSTALSGLVKKLSGTGPTSAPTQTTDDWRTATVASIGTDGTLGVTLASGGPTVTAIRFTSYRTAQIGDLVWVQIRNGVHIVHGALATSNVSDIGEEADFSYGPPAGWLVKDGSTIVATQYPALVYALTGNPAATSATLPDDRGRFLIGAGSGPSLNSVAGSGTVTLTTANLPSHTHSATSSVSDPGHPHGSDIVRASATTPGQSGSGGEDLVFPSVGTNTDSATTGISVTTTISASGSGSSFSIMPPYRAVLHCIRAF